MWKTILLLLSLLAVTTAAQAQDDAGTGGVSGSGATNTLQPPAPTPQPAAVQSRLLGAQQFSADTIQRDVPGRRPIRLVTPQGVVWIYVLIADSRNSGLASTCDLDRIHEGLTSSPPSLWVANDDRTFPYQISGPGAIFVCVFKEQAAGALVRAALSPEVTGITSVSVIAPDEGDGTDVTSPQVRSVLNGWIGTNVDQTLSLRSDDILTRADGRRWGYHALAALRFGTAQPNHAVRAYFQVVQLAHFHISLELGNSYALLFGQQGRVAAAPILVAVGADLQMSSSFYLGLHGFLSPTITFAAGAPEQVLSLTLGGRVDFGGVVAVGGGYLFDFTGNTSGTGLLSVSVGSALLQRLNTAH